MSWFAQARHWLGNRQGVVEGKISVETTPWRLLASLLSMAWFVEAKDACTGGYFIKDAIGLHPERPDGKIYPLRLTSESIAEVAKTVAVCDAFDAMTSHRPCRKGMPFEIKGGDQWLKVTPTAHQGRAADLEPDFDDDLRQRTVIASVDAMPVTALLATSAYCQASH